MRMRRMATLQDMAFLWQGLFCLVLVLGVNVFNRYYIPAMNKLTHKTTVAQLVVFGLCAVLVAYNWYTRRKFIKSEAISMGACAQTTWYTAALCLQLSTSFCAPCQTISRLSCASSSIRNGALSAVSGVLSGTMLLTLAGQGFHCKCVCSHLQGNMALQPNKLPRTT